MIDGKSDNCMHACMHVPYAGGNCCIQDPVKRMDMETGLRMDGESEWWPNTGSCEVMGGGQQTKTNMHGMRVGRSRQE